MKFLVTTTDDIITGGLYVLSKLKICNPSLVTEDIYLPKSSHRCKEFTKESNSAGMLSISTNWPNSSRSALHFSKDILQLSTFQEDYFVWTGKLFGVSGNIDGGTAGLCLPTLAF